VAEVGSYQEAAQRLGLDEHVTLVRLIGRFTKVLGHGRLLEPEAPGKVRLTSAGRRILPAARGFLESAHELGELRPEIRFSAYPTITARMAQHCPELLEQEVPLTLKNISEANRQDGGWRLVHDVAAGRLDMAIAPAGLIEETLVERPLYDWQLRVVFPRAAVGGMDGKRNVEALRRRRRVTPADIASFRMAVAPVGHTSRTLLREAFAVDDVELKVALESPNQELLRAVASGGTQFVAVIPEDAFEKTELEEAPYLRVKNADGSLNLGGSYALYMRKTDVSSSGNLPSSHQKAIEAAAEKLIDAFVRYARGE
jgi:DNA-binding transcriptional LysR family regulator